MTKYSRQRELVYEAVIANRIHPTAEFIYNYLKKDNPALSLGTVYRNLQRLSESGKILKLQIPGKAERYDGDLSPHYHAVCCECGEVTDVFMDYNNALDRSAEKGLKAEVLAHTIIFTVICEKCGCHVKRAI